MPADLLPEYRVKARNTARTSENAIHDDAVARRYGFQGGLVPGVTVYAYCTHPLVDAFGTAWLERGTATVRFVRPVLDADTLIVAGAVTARDASGMSAALTARTERDGECAVLAVTLPAGQPTAVNTALYREMPLPEDRPVATREHLLDLPGLGTPLAHYDEALAAEYLDRVDEPLPIYRGHGGRIHPAFYLHLANRALDRNVRLGPWIHVSSSVRHLGAARVGATLRTLGRVRSLYEKKGRQFVELDLIVVAGERSRPVAHVLHTAIYRLPDP